MRRIMLTVAYDGTNYHGWQLQENAESIEGVLNRTLSELLKEDIQVTGASRTDAGVHALGAIAVFDTKSRIPAEKISYAVNQFLPADVRIQKSQEVAPDFHPRKVNGRKTYEYRILNREFELPGERLNSWFYHGKLDVEAMRNAATYLVGEHDFVSFCSVHTQAEDTIRTIYSAEILTEKIEQTVDNQWLSGNLQNSNPNKAPIGDPEREYEGLIRIRVCGNGFLYNMVRIIAGTLLQVGTGRIAPEDVHRMLLLRDRTKAGMTAPAHGLTMIGLQYEEELADFVDAKNEFWDYTIDQRGLKGHFPEKKEGEKTERSAEVEVRFCAPADRERLKEHILTKCFRNGAEKVVYKDSETGIRTVETA